jgi:tyrosinase
VGRYALDGHPFSIRFFVGNVPDGTINAIAQALTQVGEIYNFVDPVEFDKPNCENCARQAREHLKITGQVPLTNALLTRFKQQIPHETESGETMVLQGMDPEHVVPFLRANFHWRVTDVSHCPPILNCPIFFLLHFPSSRLYPYSLETISLLTTLPA